MKVELLSPAGTLEKLKTAFLFGADAVYAGVPDFSLRSRINDFDYEKMKEGVEYAHKNNKKVYATLNIYPNNSQLENIEDAVKKYSQINIDALIVSDAGIISIIKNTAPDMEIHLSTQANCTNWQAAKFWYEQGVKRIVLAREVTLNEIKEIHKKVPDLELEYFVHGAMCMSYSGRCILSKFLSDRSANQGWCSQPCRWAYDISPVNEVDKELQIEEDEHGVYLLNSKDLCLIEYLNDLKEAGIISFKIEGRTKSAYYVAAITKLYRQTINNGLKPPAGWKKELEKFVNRGYTTGFLFGEEKCEHNFEKSHKNCDWQFVGEMVKISEKKAYVKVHNEIYIGDDIEIIAPSGDNIKFKVAKMQDAETGETIEEAHGGQNKIIIIEVGKNIENLSGTMIRKEIKTVSQV